MTTKLFKNDNILNGLKSIKNCFKSIDSTLSSRGNDYGFRELSSYTEELKKLRSPRTNGISLDDIYSFENGKLCETTDDSKKFEFNTGSSGSYYPTVILSDDYSHMLENTVGLSSVNITTDFMFGGLQYAFKNCINLKTATFNIKNTEFDVTIPSDGYITCFVYYDGSHTNLYNIKKEHGFIFTPREISTVSLSVSFKAESFNKYYRNRVATTNIQTSNLLYKAFEGCTSLEQIAFPSLNKDDIMLTPSNFYTCTACQGRGGTTTHIGETSVWKTCGICNGTGKEPQKAHFSTKEDFVDYFGLNTISADVIFNFKDGTFTVDELFNN